jgi:cilia- and flagella-associated protein 57
MVIANQLKEIHLKDEQIAQREKKIYSLKKKT